MANAQTLLDKGKVKILQEPAAPGNYTFKVSGVVDEDTDFGVIAKVLGPGPATLHFDLGGITRINSCGVREWLLLLEKLGADRKLVIETVSLILIEQANMIPNLLGKKGTPVLSFQAPYRCNSCNKEVTTLLRPEHVRKPDGSFAAPEMKCPTCSKTLEFDWMEEEFFNFLRR
ncbi:MAG: hypothetical protein ACXWPM_09375 [Bdellovibrionota bacterium]